MPKIVSTAVENAVRSALVADVKAVWATRKIATSAPEVELPEGNDQTTLPVAAVMLAAPVTFDSEAAGAGTLGPRMQWTITGRFFKPKNADLIALKVARADALLEALTALPGHYADCVWFPGDVSYDLNPDASDANRDYFEIVIGIVLHG